MALCRAPDPLDKQLAVSYLRECWEVSEGVTEGGREWSGVRGWADPACLPLDICLSVVSWCVLHVSLRRVSLCKNRCMLLP
jgi:hypothetical protein